jgi:hypothetical protein
LVASQGQAQVSVQDFWDGKKLLEQAQSSGAEVAMVFNYRFFDQTERARQLIDERDFGPRSESWRCPTTPRGAIASISCSSTAGGCGRSRGVGVSSLEATARPVRRRTLRLRSSSIRAPSGPIVGTNGLEWGFPLFELMLTFERGRIHLRGLDQDMEVLDSAGGTHEVFRPSRETSRWDKYDASFDKSIAAYLDSVRKASRRRFRESPASSSSSSKQACNSRSPTGRR